MLSTDIYTVFYLKSLLCSA